MKIASVQPSLNLLQNQNIQNLPQSKISFNARTFTPEQLEKCKKIINTSSNTNFVSLMVSAGTFPATMGLSLATHLCITKSVIKKNMKNYLSDILKLSSKDKEKVESRLSDNVFTSVEKLGNNFIKKASELD